MLNSGSLGFSGRSSLPGESFGVPSTAVVSLVAKISPWDEDTLNSLNSLKPINARHP